MRPFHLPLALALTLVPAASFADTFGSGNNQFSIDFVPIGNAGNLDDSTGYGRVNYDYRLSTYEISVAMVSKANDAGNLGISMYQWGSDRPATEVSWNEAARFVNWLNVSSGFAPAYKFGSQPGDPGYSSGATIQLWQNADAGYNAANPFRNSLAYYFLPSIDEWYKAAYHANDGLTGNYYDYPTGSNAIPDGIDFAGDSSFDAVFDQGFHANSPNAVSNVGLASPYGVFGLSGNVHEWTESANDGFNNDPLELRATRGGFWLFGSSALLAPGSGNTTPDSAWNDYGFRVASVPEPSCIWFALLSLSCLARRAR